jgi:thiol-disulfide isomerase/thioredoxin
MKKYFIYSSAFFALLFFYSVTATGQAPKDNFTLSGKATGLTGKYLYLSYKGWGETRKWDSTLVKNNAFKFSGYLPGPWKCFLTARATKQANEDANITIPLYLEPGAMTIDLKANHFSDAILKGSKTNDEYLALERQKLPAYRKLRAIDNAYDSLNKVMMRRETDTAQKLQLEKMIDQNLQNREPVYNELMSYNIAFVKAHPLSIISVSLITDDVANYPTAALDTSYNHLPGEIKNSFGGERISKELERRKLGVKGAETPMFAAINLQGDTITLESFQGKYVLLNFWSAECRTCRAAIPELKQLYEKYKDSLAIISIAKDDDKAKWKDAVAAEGTEMWQQVNYKYNKSDIMKMYGISSVPTMILIDPQGNIAERFGENGLEEKQLSLTFQKIFSK